MLYRNTETGEFGITHDMLLSRLPNVSFPYGIQEIGVYKAYERRDKPTVLETQQVSEGLPVNDIQTWVVTDKVNTEDSLLALKSQLKSKVTEKRWLVESGGILFPNGVKVKTSKDDQDRILSVIINAERNGIDEIDFKSESGWVKISIFALKQLAKELTYFVQHCFKTEKYHHGFIDSLTSPLEVIQYDYLSGWEFSSTGANDKVLTIYNLNINDIMVLLYSNFIFAETNGTAVYVNTDKFSDAQYLIDKLHYGVSELTPNQFYYLLAKTGLDDAIETLLPPLKLEDINKYSRYKAYLYGAKSYEFSKAYTLYLDIKAKILAVNSSLDFTVNELKTVWEEASSV